jgi:hypothetical protein
MLKPIDILYCELSSFSVFVDTDFVTNYNNIWRGAIMGSYTDYDKDERPSWSEIDKKRDRSSHSKGDEKKTAPKPGANRWNTGRHKQALAMLFKGDKGTIEHIKMHTKMHKSYGSSTFLQAVQAYIEKFGPPDDMSSLLILLDSKNASVMNMAMEKLAQIYDDMTNREKEDIRRKISIVALTDRSVDIRETAFEILDELKDRS